MADLIDFPVYVNTDDLGNNFYESVRNDCGDVRITSADGLAEIPREVVFCDGSNGEIHFKAPFLSASNDTDFYIYFGNSSATDYDYSDTYGRNAVWSGYEAVWHMSQTSSLVDSTGVYDSVSASGTRTLIDGRVGKGVALSGNGRFSMGNVLDKGGTVPYTLSAWFYLNSNPAVNQAIAGKNTTSSPFKGYELIIGDTSRFGTNIGSHYGTGQYVSRRTSLNSINTITWYHGVATYNGSKTHGGINVYRDGIVNNNLNAGAGWTSGNSSSAANWTIGSRNNSSQLPFAGRVDEVRLSNVVLSADWIATEYNNQFSPSTFYTVGALE
jgi:hypothetical protein